MAALIEKDIPAITEWLLQQGCEIIPITDSNELLRFKGKETGVIYRTGNTSGRYVQNMLECYISRSRWDGAPVSTGRQGSYKKHKIKLLKRDGSNCFYCGLPLGEDITLEHLIPLVARGPNALSNMVLAHEHCNRAVGHKPLFEKVRYAIEVQKLIG